MKEGKKGNRQSQKERQNKRKERQKERGWIARAKEVFFASVFCTPSTTTTNTTITRKQQSEGSWEWVTPQNY